MSEENSMHRDLSTLLSVLFAGLLMVSLDANATRVIEPRSAAFWNGEELQQRLSLGIPWKQLSPYEERARLEATTYLWGVADTIEGSSACLLGLPNEPVMANLVLDYLHTHSSELKSPAAQLIKAALSESFPCPAPSQAKLETANPPRSGDKDSISVRFDVEGGYKNSIWLRDDVDGEMTIALDIVRLKSTTKWAASFFVGTHAAGRDEKYLFNLIIDQPGGKARATFRLGDKDKEIFSRTSALRFDSHEKLLVTISSIKSTFSISVNGQLLDTAELPYDPDFIQIGASSGKFTATF